MNKHSIFYILTAPVALASMLSLQSCTDGRSAANIIPKGSEPIPVKVVRLQKTGDAGVIKVTGQLTTNDESILGFKTGGVVSAVLVKEGDPVRKGQLLATLDLTEVNALVAQAKFGYEKAKRDHQRATQLYKDSVATLEQLQNAETAFEVAQQQWEAARFNKNFSEIRAPSTGFVLRKFVNTGQVVSTGDPVLLTNAVSDGKWILKAGVSDKQWAAIKLRDKAMVRIDALPDRNLKAEVIRKSETADPSTGMFTVDLSLGNNGIKLGTGMFGYARIESGGNIESWSVPFEAVLDANGKDGFVFVTHDNRTAHKQPVTIESFNNTTMHISAGLDSAGALIVSGSAYLTDGSKIYITH